MRQIRPVALDNELERKHTMKITSINPWLIKAGGTFWGEYFFVEVETDEGISGWGEITTTTPPANRAIATLVRQVNDLLVGEDPSKMERLWHKVFRSFTYMGSRGATTPYIVWRYSRSRNSAGGSAFGLNGALFDSVQEPYAEWTPYRSNTRIGNRAIGP